MRFGRVTAIMLSGCGLAACGGSGSPSPAPPRDCASALECAETFTTSDQACRFDSANSTLKFYNITNRHPNRKVFVTYEQKVRHMNTVGRPDEFETKMIGLDPRKSETLGCARTKGLLSNQFDEWSYTIVAACFSDTCPAPGPTKPIDQRPAALTCERACQDGEIYCLKADVSSTVPLGGQLSAALRRLTLDISRVNPPGKVDMTPIVEASNAYTGSTQCSRSDLFVDSSTTADFPFHNAGSSCQVGVSVNHPKVSAIELTLPGEFSGGMQKDAAAQSFLFAPQGEANMPKLFITEISDRPVYEPVILIQGQQGKWTITGQKYYCAQITFNPG